MYLPYIALILLISSLGMLITRDARPKILVLVGIFLYNVLLPSFHIIVSNYYTMRDWIAIAAGMLYLMALDHNTEQEEKQIKQKRLL